jgi:hypothetical protein
VKTRNDPVAGHPPGVLGFLAVSAPATLCRELRHLRARGLTFDAAWPKALEVAVLTDYNAGDWPDVLTATRHGWQAAYDRGPSRRRENAVSMVSLDCNGNGHEHHDVDNRACAHCGLGIPKFAPSGARKKSSALYCGSECQRAANRRGAVVELVA